MASTPEAPNFENQSHGLLDNTPAFVFATVTPLLTTFIEAGNVEAGFLIFVVGEAIAAILFIKGMPRKPKNELPKKPLAAENPSNQNVVTIFRPANATS